MRPRAVRYDAISLQCWGMEVFIFISSKHLIGQVDYRNSLGGAVAESLNVRFTCEPTKIPAVLC